MGALDTAIEAVRIAKTSGLAKAVVDRLEKKLSVLAEEVRTLQNENASLKVENERLQTRLKQLPAAHGDEISPDTKGILKLFFDRANDVSADEIAKAFGWKQSVADYHIDVLLKKRFIRESTLGMETPFGSSVSKFGLTTLGRRYIIEYMVS
jgi:regulator of replication initiation timing